MKTDIASENKLVEHVQDFRSENPGLHMLCTKTAVLHLTQIDKALKEFENCSSLNMNDVWLALWYERVKLLRTNAAYMEAQNILNQIRYAKGKRIHISSDDHKNEEDKQKERV